MELFETILRDSTTWYIGRDATTVVMVPQTRLRAPGGGFTLVAGTPRPAQQVKLIGVSQDGISPGEGGTDRQFEYTIVAEWDAQITLNDRFEDSRGNPFYVYAIEPFNGYEVKARARAYGKNVTDG